MDTNMRVLIVDDFSTMRRILRSVLEEIGFNEIDEADSGSAALYKLKENNYDIMLTDWNMPNMTGLELLRTVRSINKLSQMPVFLVTAEAKKEQIVEAAEAGVNGYILKPFTTDNMREKLTKVLG